MLKLLSIKYHFVKEQVENGKFILQYTSTKDQLADGMTKPIARDKLAQFKKLIGLQKQDSDTDKLMTESGGALKYPNELRLPQGSRGE
jgi:hypothetical protein